MRVFVPMFAVFILAASAHGQTAEEKTRPPTPDEIKSFTAFYKQRYSVNRVPDIDFSVTRASKNAPWLVQASVFITLGKGFKNLCHGETYRYSYDRHGSQSPSWELASSGGKTEYVWLGDSSCGNSGKRILVTAQLPDTDAIDLLENADSIWRKHSLLIAGNSGCERVIRSDLKLVSIGVDRNSPSPESMLQITYSGGSYGSAEVFLRKKGKDMMPWIVRCALP